ncbi:MAG TPA: B12-binding domain-containing radical SAM protein [Spirochaetes bacterium]|nr:B12-binding domain-containing radical SAM protein [Spirochaetota bacterium]
MKIALIEPKPPFDAYFFLKKLPLLGNLFLGTMMKNAGHTVKVYKENMIPAYNEKTDEFLPFIREADVVGITGITHTANRAYLLADALKRQFPEKKVVLGGPHVSALPEEGFQHADQVVVGEGENVVLDVFEGRNKDDIVYGSVVNMNDVPPLDLKILQGYRYKKEKIDMKHAPIMASRGCPYDCNFCSVTKMFGRKYRIKDPDLVMEEVMMRYHEGFRYAFFYDDNFAANHEKTKIFLEKLIRADIDLRWSSQFRVEVVKDKEMVDLLSRAKCSTVFIGVESINPKALLDYNKKQSVEDIKKCIKTLSERGMKVHSMFVLGADSDNGETIEETIRFSRASKSTTAQFSILFPIPGTRLYQEMKDQDRIFINNWDYYDGSHTVILPKQITPIKLQKKLIHAYKHFYATTIITWLMSRLGFFMWKLTNKKFLRYLRYFTRKLKKAGAIQNGILTHKGPLTDLVPKKLSEAIIRK